MCRIITLTLSLLLHLSSTRALWIPQQENAFGIAEDFNSLSTRQSSTCGGDSSLNQCGGTFPSEFCCAADTRCLLLNTTSSVIATLCCPAGHDCRTINPVDCSENLQNATSNPSSPLHASPPLTLQSCGTACCPMGYLCSGGSCFAIDSSPTSPSVSSSSGLATSSTSTSASPSPTSSSGSEVAPTAQPGPQTKLTFSGPSFAAGFVPGIALGAVVAGCLLVFCFRKDRRRSANYVSEKPDSSQDSLNEPDYAMMIRPVMHGRSISEPTVDPNFGHRTEFLHYTPTSHLDTGNGVNQYGNRVQIQSLASNAATPSGQAESNPPKLKALFSRSPFLQQAQTPVPTQAPMPSHLKRGTISYQISPVRALKKQRSMQSLRRQMTDTTSRSSSSRRQRTQNSRTASTETIEVLMRTPDYPSLYSTIASRQAAAPEPSNASSSWHSTSDESSTSIDAEPTVYGADRSFSTNVEMSTPTQPSRNNGNRALGLTLGTPYTPSNYLDNGGSPRVVPRPLKRETTFSSMMERAGLRKEDLAVPVNTNADATKSRTAGRKR